MPRATRSFSWPEVFERLARFPYDDKPRAYGVPRGGAIVAGLLAALGKVVVVERPEDAHLVVDDLVDSGRTLERFREASTWVMVDKPRENLLGTWVRFPWEEPDEVNLSHHAAHLLQGIGADLRVDGLRETPRRLVSSLRELTRGYEVDPSTYLRTTFAATYDEMVVVRSIPFYSLCEHHVLPFHGTATVGYLPKPGGRIVGLSKIARVVRAYARRLQVQERMTEEVARCVFETLDAKGAGVVVEARHLCMEARGVETPGAPTVTSCLLGHFRESPSARAEFLSLARPSAVA